MDARTYLQQVRDLYATVRTLQMRVRESREALDMLRSLTPTESTGGTARSLEEAIADAEELMDGYTAELLRWSALREQAFAMMDRTRSVLADGSPHAIRLAHVDVVERYYLHRHGRERIAREMGYSTIQVDKLKAECLDWMDHAVDADGYPIVPVVSE